MPQPQSNPIAPDLTAFLYRYTWNWQQRNCFTLARDIRSLYCPDRPLPDFSHVYTVDHPTEESFPDDGILYLLKKHAIEREEGTPIEPLDLLAIEKSDFDKEICLGTAVEYGGRLQVVLFTGVKAQIVPIQKVILRVRSVWSY